MVTNTAPLKHLLGLPKPNEPIRPLKVSAPMVLPNGARFSAEVNAELGWGTIPGPRLTACVENVSVRTIPRDVSEVTLLLDGVQVECGIRNSHLEQSPEHA